MLGAQLATDILQRERVEAARVEHGEQARERPERGKRAFSQAEVGQLSAAPHRYMKQFFAADDVILRTINYYIAEMIDITLEIKGGDKREGFWLLTQRTKHRNTTPLFQAGILSESGRCPVRIMPFRVS